MVWEVEFYNGVEESILELPPKLQARMLRLLEMVECYGPNLGEPHTKSLGDGLFELRAKAKEGIARGLFCYMKQQRVYILHIFIKKSQKTPSKELAIGRFRMSEVQSYE